jgi:lysophospholipase L1-like esterase
MRPHQRVDMHRVPCALVADGSNQTQGELRAIATISIVVLACLVVAVLGLRALGIGQHRSPVALVGDSITANLESTIERRRGDDYSFTVDGKPGFLAAQQVEAAQNVGRFPFDQVVVNLGTNDAMTSDQDLDETVAALGQIVDTLSQIRCVHLVTINEQMLNDTGDAGTRARQLNEAIRAVAATHPNVDVIDWAAVVREYQRTHDEPITTDTVHPNDIGNPLLADAYGDALDACAN